MTEQDGEGLRERLARQSEDAFGKLAQDLLENSLINSAITRAFSARERAAHAQEAAMGALNVPSAADVERLTKRLRSVSQRLEGVEERLDGIQEGIDKLSVDVAAVASALDARPAPVHRSQERLAVDGPPAKPARGRAKKS